jgi:hypothetical protein
MYSYASIGTAPSLFHANGVFTNESGFMDDPGSNRNAMSAGLPVLMTGNSSDGTVEAMPSVE